MPIPYLAWHDRPRLTYIYVWVCVGVCGCIQVDGGVLKEGLISVGSKKAEEPDPLDPEIIKRFDNRFQYNP